MLDIHAESYAYASDSQPKKKSDLAYDRIRQSIVEFQLLPGAFIDKAEICKSLGFSRQPVTTALSRLEREGLVEILPQRGSYVTRLSLSIIVENVSIQAALEAFAVQTLARAPRPEILATLKTIVASMEGAVSANDAAAFADLEQSFHRTIAAGTGLPKLAEQVEVGLAAISRCLHVMPPDLLHLTHALEQYRAITTAIEAGEGLAAATVLSDHLERFRQHVEVQANARPEVFIR
jgi:DNA-binding GntR family transcriptional regulator